MNLKNSLCCNGVVLTGIDGIVVSSRRFVGQCNPGPGLSVPVAVSGVLWGLCGDYRCNRSFPFFQLFLFVTTYTFMIHRTQDDHPVLHF
jgi:hypothetical protein